jgi:hypothetical protein
MYDFAVGPSKYKFEGHGLNLIKFLISEFSTPTDMIVIEKHLGCTSKLHHQLSLFHH